MADFDGDHIDDYVWIEAASGQPTLYLNAGPDEGAPDGWLFTNQGVIASGAGPRDLVHFADIDGKFLVLENDMISSYTQLCLPRSCVSADASIV